MDQRSLEYERMRELLHTTQEVLHNERETKTLALTELASLRADVERLTRELREARAAIRAYTPRCFVCSRSGTKAWAGQRHRYCDAHADTGHNDVECAPAIRAAEGET